MKDDALARAVRDHYRENAEDTVDDVAEALGEPHDRIVRILDEYRVTDGQVEHAGPGGGGGWIPVAG